MTATQPGQHRYECSIDARKAGALGVYHMAVNCVVSAENEHEARLKALHEFCAMKNLETRPPMTVCCLTQPGQHTPGLDT